MSYNFLHLPTGQSQQDLQTGGLNKCPLTPYPTSQDFKQLSSNGIVSTSSEIGQSVKHGAFCHFMHTAPPFSLYRSPPVSLRISSAELHRVLDSLMNQINWLEVAVQAGKGRAPSIYCDVLEKILQAQISQLVEAENKIQGRNRGDREYVHVYEADDEDEDEDEDEEEEEEEEDTEVEGSITGFLAEGTEDEEEDGDYEAIEEYEEEADEYSEMEEDDSEYNSV